MMCPLIFALCILSANIFAIDIDIHPAFNSNGSYGTTQALHASDEYIWPRRLFDEYEDPEKNDIVFLAEKLNSPNEKYQGHIGQIKGIKHKKYTVEILNGKSGKEVASKVVEIIDVTRGEIKTYQKLGHTIAEVFPKCSYVEENKLKNVPVCRIKCNNFGFSCSHVLGEMFSDTGTYKYEESEFCGGSRQNRQYLCLHTKPETFQKKLKPLPPSKSVVDYKKKSMKYYRLKAFPQDKDYRLLVQNRLPIWMDVSSKDTAPKNIDNQNIIKFIKPKDIAHETFPEDGTYNQYYWVVMADNQEDMRYFHQSKWDGVKWKEFYDDCDHSSLLSEDERKKKEIHIAGEFQTDPKGKFFYWTTDRAVNGLNIDQFPEMRYLWHAFGMSPIPSQNPPVVVDPKAQRFPVWITQKDPAPAAMQIVTQIELKKLSRSGKLEKSSRYAFIIMADAKGKMRIFKESDIIDPTKGDEKDVYPGCGHTSLMNEVERIESGQSDASLTNNKALLIYAGTFVTDENGHIIYWSNDSGHFQPDAKWNKVITEFWFNFKGDLKKLVAFKRAEFAHYVGYSDFMDMDTMSDVNDGYYQDVNGRNYQEDVSDDDMDDMDSKYAEIVNLNSMPSPTMGLNVFISIMGFIAFICCYCIIGEICCFCGVGAGFVAHAKKYQLENDCDTINDLNVV